MVWASQVWAAGAMAKPDLPLTGQLLEGMSVKAAPADEIPVLLAKARVLRSDSQRRSEALAIYAELAERAMGLQRTKQVQVRSVDVLQHVVDPGLAVAGHEIADHLMADQLALADGLVLV